MPTPPLDPPFALTDEDRQSPLWRRLEAHFTDKLARLRVQNDAALTEQQTSALRGRIDTLKAIINLGKPGQPTGE